jgi:hypothetical protein
MSLALNLTSFHTEMWVSGGRAPLFLRLYIWCVSFTLWPPYSSTNWTVGYVGTRTGLDTAVANISLLLLLGNQTSIIQHSLMTIMIELSQLQGKVSYSTQTRRWSPQGMRGMW